MAQHWNTFYVEHIQIKHFCMTIFLFISGMKIFFLVCKFSCDLQELFTKLVWKNVLVRMHERTINKKL